MINFMRPTEHRVLQLDRSKPPSERNLSALAREAIRSALPPTWSVDVEASPRRARGDAAITLRAPDGRTARLAIEIKTLVDARDVPVLASRLAALAHDTTGAIVVARYLSPRTREALATAGLSYLDATGNVRLQVEAPALFLATTGAASDPWRERDRPTNTLRGRPAARVVRALVDLRPPWKVRDLAVAAKTSLGSTARTLDFLDREALVTRNASGSVTAVTWDALLERWAADYDLIQKQRVVRLIDPRGAGDVEARAADSGLRYAVSGSLAARRRMPYADPKLAVLYAEDLEQMRTRLALRAVESGANVLLIEPDDDLVFERTWQEAGVTYAALAQVVVDLLAGPGRNPEEGQALLQWMRTNEAKWRASP